MAASLAPQGKTSDGRGVGQIPKAESRMALPFLLKSPYLAKKGALVLRQPNERVFHSACIGRESHITVRRKSGSFPFY